MTPATGFSGGADRDRTGGLLVANQALSQLSYSPNRKFQSFAFQSFNAFETLKLCHLETLILVGLDRLELSTSPLSGVRSSHLSYRPGHAFAAFCKIPEPAFYIFDPQICTGSQLLASSQIGILIQLGARS